MKNPLVIEDKMIHSPTVGTNGVSNIRPSGPGWHVPVNGTHKPEVTVVLSKTPVNVQELTITGIVDVQTSIKFILLKSKYFKYTCRFDLFCKLIFYLQD